MALKDMEIDELKATINEKNLVLKDYMQQVASLNGQLSNVTKELAVAVEMRDHFKGLLESAQAELKSRAATITAQASEIADMESDLFFANAKIDHLNSEIAKLSAEAEANIAQFIADSQIKMNAMMAEMAAAHAEDLIEEYNAGFTAGVASVIPEDGVSQDLSLIHISEPTRPY